MQRIVIMQFFTMAVVAAIAGVLGGVSAAFSAALGGVCCVVPNAFFAWRLHASTRRPGTATPTTFFVGEFLKIAMTLALMGAVIGLYRDVNWLAFLASYIVVLKSYLFLLFTRST